VSENEFEEKKRIPSRKPNIYQHEKTVVLSMIYDKRFENNIVKEFA
jgi:hypothetical protein